MCLAQSGPGGQVGGSRLVDKLRFSLVTHWLGPGRSLSFSFDSDLSEAALLCRSFVGLKGPVCKVALRPAPCPILTLTSGCCSSPSARMESRVF